MKSRKLKRMAGAFATIVLSLQLVAQSTKHHHYKLIDMGTLGGPSGSLGFEGERDINNRGTVVSTADSTTSDPYAPNCFSADCFVSHTVIWQDGHLSDQGALPGINNSGPIWISDSGLIAGVSQNGSTDQNGMFEFRAVLFKDGKVINLGTFGGNESEAFGVNDHGQVVGCAANAVADPFGFICFGAPQQSRAFLWRDGVMRDLGTLGGPDALAELVNDRGQVAGWSMTDSTVNPVTGFPTEHPFLWENGKMRDLGTIGGTQVNQINSMNNGGQFVGAMNVAGDQSYHPFLWDGESLKDLGTLGGDFGSANWINESGEVVGWAYSSGNQASHAFLWQKGDTTDLGTVDGDPYSDAYVINSKRQVIGGSYNENSGHAFLWENSSIVDLNALITAHPGVQLQVALGLNELGEIAAQGVLTNGDSHAFLLIPCDGNHPGIEGCDYSLVDASTTANTGASDFPYVIPNTSNTSIIEPLKKGGGGGSGGGGTGGSGGGRCTPEGMECPPIFPPCCPGLTCVPESTRAFCLRL